MIPRSFSVPIKPLLLLLSTWYFSVSALAIDISTQVSLVSHEQDFQLLGSFTLKVDNDAFSDASPSNPLYIRFRTLHSRGWSKTVVDMRHPANHAPVNIAIFPVTQSTAINPGLPADAVQLVRLIEGEREGWLRINRSSSTWVATNNIGVAPSPDQPVGVSLGLRGSQSIRDGANTPSGGNERADSGYLADTSMFADYRQTSSFRVGTLERLDFIAVDSDTLGVETTDGIFLGGSLSVSFSDDVVVARGEAYVPCMEFHNDPESYDTVVMDRPLTRFDLLRARTYGLQVPELFLTNSSDFEWRDGTRLFVTLPEFSGKAYAEGEPQSITRLNPSRQFRWQPTDLTVTSSGNSSWRVLPIWWNEEVFAGYELVLESGVFDVYETLKLTGMLVELDHDFRFETIRLSAHAVYSNPVVTQSESAHLGPLSHTLFQLYPGDDNFHRKVLPYTAFDEPEWSFKGHVANPHNAPVEMTMLFYNRHGILLKVAPVETLPPHCKKVFDVTSLFGEEAAGVLSWVEILSLQPLGAAGVIESRDGTMLDIYSGVTDSHQTLYGAHLPSRLSWDVKAFVVASNLAPENSFYLEMPGYGEERLSGFFFPGGTATLDDGNFIKDTVRTPWFRINANSPEGGNGLLFFSRRDELAQLVSTPLDLQPALQWRFDHLGSWDHDWWNGLVLTNPNETSAAVTANLYDENNDRVDTFTMALAPGEKSVDVVTSYLNGTPERSYQRMDLVSDVPVLSFLLMGQYSKAVATRVRGNLAGSRRKLLPVAFNATQARAGYTGLALVNPFALDTEVTVTPYTDKGVAGPPVTVAIPRFSKQVHLLADLVGGPNAYTHVVLEGSRQFTAFGLVGSTDNQQLATVDLLNLD